MQNFGIYVHIPFCQKKCQYCDFVSFDEWNEQMQQDYIKCLLQEMENNTIAQKVTTIYIGGGTPSILPAVEIQKVLEKIREKFQIAKKAEITIEINPGTVDRAKLEQYRKMGINRLSIGLQSTHNRLLEMLGRIHRYEDFVKVYQEARETGFDNINVDLMLGLPTQNLEELKSSLKEVIAWNPEHISIYSLILEEGTMLEKQIHEHTLEMIPEALEREMYWETKRILEENDYLHYEISNFAKKGKESKHNMACWEQAEYVGFGLSAHSYLAKRRVSKTCFWEEYRKNIEQNAFQKNRIVQEEKQTLEEEAKEFMMLGLRKIRGVSISAFEQKFHINPLFYFRFEISQLEESGLLEVDLDEIRLTKKGLDLANLVFEEFV